MRRTDIKEQGQAIRQSMDAAGSFLTDEQAAESMYLYQPWEVGKEYKTWDILRYNDQLFRCLQDHTSQADWNPAAAVSLWVKIANPAQEWPEWVQPLGAHDAYNTGDKVSHNEQHWISNVDGNVWEPGVAGWDVQMD